MIKIDKDMRKRWLLFTLLNMLILMLVFGALIAGFVAFAANADRRMLEDSVVDYASVLKQYSFKELSDACKGDSYLSVDANNPGVSFGIYTVRGDGSYSFSSKDVFLSANSPQIGGKADVVNKEDIGGHTFFTYTTAIKDNAGGYIKVFAPADFLNAASDYVKVYSIPFAIGFLVLCAAVSLALGYIEIKPITDSYYKQKGFINDMSHEIRTPLAIIKGNLENMLAMPEATVEENADLIGACLNEVDYMTNMSAGLLNIVRGQSKSSKKEGLMSEAVSETVDMFADVTAMSNKALVACVDFCDIAVDKEKIKQLMSVLVENALKYTDDGDRINVRLKNTKDGCVLIVSDNGIGVNKNELDLIFDRFYRGENAKEIPGTGLGLSIAKSIVESMNGNIRAAANVPHGLEIIATIKRG